MTALKPCPFCGNREAEPFFVAAEAYRPARVGCVTCNITISAQDAEYLINLWNTRHVPELSAEDKSAAFHAIDQALIDNCTNESATAEGTFALMAEQLDVRGLAIVRAKP